MGNFINEATFYGKNIMLLKAEKIIEEMKGCFTKKSALNYNIDNDKFYKYTTQLETIFKNLFGFSDVYINKSVFGNIAKIMSNNPGMITYTKSILLFDTTKRLNGDYDAEKVKISDYHDGVKFKPNTNIKLILMVDNALFINNDINEFNFTPAEILAFMLHEIGHNFYNDKDRILASNLMNTVIFPYFTIRYLVQNVYLSLFLKTDDLLLNKKIGEDKYIGEIISKTVANLDSLFLITKSNIMTTIDKIENIFFGLGLIVNPAVYAILIPSIITKSISSIDARTLIIGKQGEEFADSFATAFGYGAELSSGLLKRDEYMQGYYPNIRYNIKNKCLLDIIDSVSQIAILPIYFFFSALDDHPATENRIQRSIDYLNDCEEYIDNPRLKKEYLNNVSKLNNLKESTIKKAEGSYRITDKEKALVFKILDSDIGKSLSELSKIKKYTNIDVE